MYDLSSSWLLQQNSLDDDDDDIDTSHGSSVNRAVSPNTIIQLRSVSGARKPSGRAEMRSRLSSGSGSSDEFEESSSRSLSARLNSNGTDRSPARFSRDVPHAAGSVVRPANQTAKYKPPDAEDLEL